MTYPGDGKQDGVHVKDSRILRDRGTLVARAKIFSECNGQAGDGGQEQETDHELQGERRVVTL